MDTNLPELWPLLWTATFETLYIVAITLVLGGLLGLLLGLGLYVTRGGGLYPSRGVAAVLNVVVDFFRPIAATFFIARIVEQNLVTVPPGVIEAARSVGASRPRIIATVLLPEALGPLILGYTFVFVAIVDATAIAGVIGGGGLGNFALQYGFRQVDTVVTWTAVVIIVVLVQVVQLAGNLAARRVLRR